MTLVASRRSILLGSLALGALSSDQALAKGAGPIAKTTNGLVQGTTDKAILAFKGIRYGADTRGSRFMPPLPPQRWRGVKSALAYGAASPQGSNEANQSEDCCSSTFGRLPCATAANAP